MEQKLITTNLLSLLFSIHISPGHQIPYQAYHSQVSTEISSLAGKEPWGNTFYTKSSHYSCSPRLLFPVIVSDCQNVKTYPRRLRVFERRQATETRRWCCTVSNFLSYRSVAVSSETILTRCKAEILYSINRVHFNGRCPLQTSSSTAVWGDHQKDSCDDYSVNCFPSLGSFSSNDRNYS